MLCKLLNYQITNLVPALLLSIEIHEQIGRFINPYAVELGGLQFRREALPDGDCDVLRGWDLFCKFRNLFVEETMVHCVEDFAIHSFLKLLEINYEAGTWINLALHRDFEHVIVPVAVGVIAFAEDTLVLLRSEVRIVIIVRGSEFRFAGEIEQGRSDSFPALKSNCNGKDADCGKIGAVSVLAPLLPRSLWQGGGSDLSNLTEIKNQNLHLVSPNNGETRTGIPANTRRGGLWIARHVSTGKACERPAVAKGRHEFTFPQGAVPTGLVLAPPRTRRLRAGLSSCRSRGAGVRRFMRHRFRRNTSVFSALPTHRTASMQVGRTNQQIHEDGQAPDRQ